MTSALARPARAPAAPSRGMGRNEWGTITIADAAVSKLAAQAAVEIPDAGAAAPRVLRRSVPGAGHFGVPGSSLTGAPKASARVDGSVALIEIVLSVRWPAPVPRVTDEVRRHVRHRLGELAGLQVPEVTITVSDLVTRSPKTARVQ